jgi:hypothetical protein
MGTETAASSKAAASPGGAAKPWRWKFYRSGGVDQVLLRDGADLSHLDELDQKLWMALAMPTTGIEFDARTAQLLDADGDGRIRPPEVLSALRWAARAFRNLDDVLAAGDSVPLEAIADPDILAGARRILTNLGRTGATAIGIGDVADRALVFANTTLNGDGIITADDADDDATRAVVADVIAAMGAVPDRSGKPGVNQANLDAFFADAQRFAEWAGREASDPGVSPLGPDATAAAAGAVAAVAAKVDDYFARCRLAAFDARATPALNREEREFAVIAARDLTLQSGEIAALPLARVEAGRPLPLRGAVNPSWSAALAALADRAAGPLLGGARDAQSETDWASLRARLAPYDAWRTAKPATRVEALGAGRLRDILAGGARERIAALIARDAALEKENAQIEQVEKLVRFRRHLGEFLKNYVNFANFYGRAGAVFQAGTLYLDARACELCIEVVDPAKHAALAGLSGAFLAYCDIARAGAPKKSIVAVFTDGDSDTLMAGRNGVFYDRQGRDWDATITRVVSNPISVREAFWLPYKRLIRFIEDQVTKRAQAADAASTAKMTAAAAAPAPPKKLDLGTIALIGTAIGGVSALVGGFLQALFGLGLWLPLGVVGILLLISGPSMLLASLKLRQRNLGPILDANGWAINTRARMNMAFGAALTRLAALPRGSERMLEDPFADRKRPWKWYLLALAVLGLACAWTLGRLDGYLPGFARRSTVFPSAIAAPATAPAPAPPSGATP